MRPSRNVVRVAREDSAFVRGLQRAIAHHVRTTRPNGRSLWSLHVTAPDAFGPRTYAGVFDFLHGLGEGDEGGFLVEDFSPDSRRLHWHGVALTRQAAADLVKMTSRFIGTSRRANAFNPIRGGWLADNPDVDQVIAYACKAGPVPAGVEDRMKCGGIFREFRSEVVRACCADSTSPAWVTRCEACERPIGLLARSDRGTCSPRCRIAASRRRARSQ